MDQIERILKGELRGVDAVKKAAAPAREFPSFAGARVLAADDSAVNREVVREALSRLDIEAVVVEDGRAAVDAATTERFDLILMDCSMPGMDGYEATRAIRLFEQENRRRTTPIIALTAHVQGEIDRWRAAGMNEYLTKPFTIATLSTAIGSFLPQMKQAARIAPPRAAATKVALPPPVEAAAPSAPARSSPESAAAAAPPRTESKKPTAEPSSKRAEKAPAPEETETPPAAAAQSAAFDEQTLRSLAEMGSASSDIVARALKLFEEHSKPAAQRLAKAMRAGDAKEIKSAAHALKGMSFNVGAKKLGGVCAQIEGAAAAGAGNYPALAQWLRIAFTEAHRDLPSVYKRYAKRAA
jgi:two-component system sensor histidine kinase BarA